MRRFTETGKWTDPWFRKLSPIEKLVFLYVIENCNNAGFYEVDIEAIGFDTGLRTADIEGALMGLTRGLQGASGWVWVKNFLKHQKNDQLNEKNPAHKQIIGFLNEQYSRFIECEDFKQFVAPYKGLVSPIGKVKVKVKASAQPKTEDAPSAFDSFWTEYPNKVAKDKARSSFDSQGCAEILAVVLSGLGRAKASQQWQKDSGQFIPHPATWINQRRWEAVLEPLEPAAGALRGAPKPEDFADL